MVRSTAYWESVIAPAVRAGRRVCVCGHENNLRSLLKHLDGVSDEDIVHVELPRAVPLVYHLDKLTVNATVTGIVGGHVWEHYSSITLATSLTYCYTVNGYYYDYCYCNRT
eukprot:12709-Heterococcus_DN1.PRE.5